MFGTGSEIGMSIEYSFDGPTLLGTAGAIRKALPKLPDCFFVLYGDSYLTCNYQAVEAAFVASQQPALMTVYRNENQYDSSNVEYRDRKIVRYDKERRIPEMHHIDYGLGVFRRSVFAELPEDRKTDLAMVYQQLLEAGNLAGYEVQERFFEIGSAEGLQETKEFLASEPEAG
jgi:NDP-sugar pyrophosphorylase family protein